MEDDNPIKGAAVLEAILAQCGEYIQLEAAIQSEPPKPKPEPELFLSPTGEDRDLIL